MSRDPLVRWHVDGPLAIVTLNRPDKRNALNDEMLRQLIASMAAVQGRAEIRVVLLRGAGPSFCAGVDLAEKLASRGTSGVVDYDLLLQAFAAVGGCRCPTIAVLHGTSLAGGWELGLHCDVRFAPPTARFGMPLARLGLVTPHAAASRLLQLAGPAATVDLLYSAALIDGQRAWDLGLVTHLVSADGLDGAALEYGRGIAALAPLAIAEMKRLVHALLTRGDGFDPTAFDQARRRVTASADTREGLSAFLERRTPLFSGH